jgi:hypothetical protein
LSMSIRHCSAAASPRWSSSSSAPAFRRAGSLACRLVGSELPPRSSQRSRFTSVDVSTVPFWNPVGSGRFYGLELR